MRILTGWFHSTTGGTNDIGSEHRAEAACPPPNWGFPVWEVPGQGRRLPSFWQPPRATWAPPVKRARVNLRNRLSGWGRGTGSERVQCNVRLNGPTMIASVVLTIALAAAIESDLTAWSWWWLLATAAPLILAVLAAVLALVFVAAVFLAIGVIAAIAWWRRR